MLRRWRILLLLPFLVALLSACGNAGGNGTGNGNGNVASHGAGNPNGNGLSEQSGDGNSAPTPMPNNPVTPSPTRALIGGNFGGNATSGLISTVAVVDAVGASQLSDGSVGLFRFTGDINNWTTSVSVPSSASAAKLVGLTLTVVTGNDDMRGNNAYGAIPIYDNADAIVHFISAHDATFLNINQSQRWDNFTSHTVVLSPVPASTTLERSKR